MPSLRLNNTQINGSRRFIHILQSPTTSLPPPSQDSSKFIKNVDEISADIASTKTTTDGYSTAIETAAASHTAFKVIGNPGNLLQVSLPASTPLYARRRSLLAALTPSLSSSSSSSTTTTSTSPLSLISNIQFSKHFFTKLVTGQFPLAFQKFTATEPVSILLSSSISSSPSTILPNQTTSVFTGASVSLNQSPPSPPLPIAIISLDGTLDWTLTNSASLFAYSPLSSSLFFLPSYKQRNTKITGRGILAITPKSSAAASSSVFKVVLQENESLLVAKNSLLAYSLDAQDSKPFVQPTLEKIGSSITDIKPEEAAEVEETVEEALSTTTTDDKKKNKGLSSQATLDTVKSLAKSVYSSSLAKWDQLSSPYLRVYGPTTILLNSSSLSSVAGASVSSSSSIAMFWSNLTSSNLFFSIIDNILAVALKLFKVSSSLVMQTLFNKPSLETQVSKLLLEDYKLKQQQKKMMPGSHPKNFLKIARVGPDGKVTIESTDSFKEFL